MNRLTLKEISRVLLKAAESLADCEISEGVGSGIAEGVAIARLFNYTGTGDTYANSAGPLKMFLADRLHVDAVIECEDVVKLRAELLVRTHEPGFPSRPPEYRKSGVTSAFDTGFQDAWRGVPFRKLYERRDCQWAYLAGFEQGKRESAEEIARTIKETE